MRATERLPGAEALLRRVPSQVRCFVTRCDRVNGTRVCSKLSQSVWLGNARRARETVPLMSVVPASAASDPRRPYPLHLHPLSHPPLASPSAMEPRQLAGAPVPPSDFGDLYKSAHTTTHGSMSNIDPCRQFLRYRPALRPEIHSRLGRWNGVLCSTLSATPHP